MLSLITFLKTATYFVFLSGKRSNLFFMRGMLENIELYRMDNLIEQSQNKNS